MTTAALPVPTPLEDRPWACRRKRGYSRAKAIRVASAMNTRQQKRQLHPRRDEPLAPYRCPWCQRWHVGHPPRSRP